jgi:hypothetical protein
VAGQGMIVWLPVSLFENKPERCPFGHELWLGKAQVSWTPCICEPAREAAGRGRGMGHIRVAHPGASVTTQVRAQSPK